MSMKNFIYGRNSVIESLQANSNRINKILISKNASNDVKINEIIKLAKEKGVIFQFVPKEKFHEYSDLPHQGVVAAVSPVEYLDFYDFLHKEKNGYSKVIISDGIEDPHNLGAIIRTAACAGYDAIIIPSRRNAQVNATVEKTSAGAINHIRKDNYFDINYSDMNFALIMGGEQTGVSSSNMKKADFVVKIPMLRDFNSLNVSNAAAAIIYESVRQTVQTQKHIV